jgi:saccharopine dehydrogenase-like NADP-dependent oxidoreductase
MISVGVVGTGATGGRVARHLDVCANEEPGALEVIVHDQRAALASTLAGHLGPDVRAGDIDDALGADVVVLACANPQAEIATRVVARGAACITTSDELTDVRDLLDLDEAARRHGATIVVGAGLAPGLSGLLAASLAARLDTCSEIHIAIHGTGGPACARQHHKALRGIATGWHGGEWIERPAGSGRELCWFPDPVNARDCYRAELADPLLVHSAIPGLERISARLSATRRDRFTAPFPMLRPPHREGGVGALRVEARGSLDGARETLVLGVAERAAVVAAAVSAAVVAVVVERRAAGTLPTGLVLLGDGSLPTDDLLWRVRDLGVVVAEFVGAGSH